MSKPKLSEIRGMVKGARFTDNWEGVKAGSSEYVPYLLDLVERMGKALRGKLWNCNHVLSHDANCEFCQEARALLEEIKL